MELKDTVKMMNSDDYKERFRVEYYQTKIRYEKLKKFNTKIEAANTMKIENLECIYNHILLENISFQIVKFVNFIQIIIWLILG